MEQLGYFKGKNRAEPASTLHLGKFARGRPKALPKPPADGEGSSRARRQPPQAAVRRGRVLRTKRSNSYKSGRSPCPRSSGRSSSRPKATSFYCPILPDPGPGQYKLDKDRHKALKGTMGSPPKKLSSLISPPRAPPHSYLSIETKRAYGGFSLVGKDKKVGERNKKPKPKKLSYIRQVNAGLDGFVEPDEDPDAWKKLE